jgi:DNA-binding PadR family transcriptional regulator
MGRLLEEGLIEESNERPDDDDPRRRYYTLTNEGIAAVEAEADRMGSLVDAVRASNLSRSRTVAR